MAERTKFINIYNYRMNEIAAGIDTRSANAGAARGLLLLLPYVFLLSLFEYIYKRLKIHH